MADASNTGAIPKQAKGKAESALPHCGVIMPISGTDDYPASHWADVLQLIQEAAKQAKFTCEIVSATGRDDIIHSSIVTNIYQNEIVVCDVSNRNPNVMLELGLRLASKLPIIIIFDGVGNYPFDIGTIRYLPYRRDMRYYDTEKFKKDLTAKILEVHETHKQGNYKSFLSHFKNVDFDLDTIKNETQSVTQFLESIDKRLAKFESQNNPTTSSNNRDIKLNNRQLVNYTNSAEGLLRAYLSKFVEDNNLPHGKLSLADAEKAFNSVKASGDSLLKEVFNPAALMAEILDWDGFPF